MVGVVLNSDSRTFSPVEKFKVEKSCFEREISGSTLSSSLSLMEKQQFKPTFLSSSLT